MTNPVPTRPRWTRRMTQRAVCVAMFLSLGIEPVAHAQVLLTSDPEQGSGIQGGLEARFLNEFERVAKLLIDFPGIGTPADDLRRVHPLHDFPYSVIYREIGGHIRVLVVRGHFRDPEHGESRR